MAVRAEAHRGERAQQPSACLLMVSATVRVSVFKPSHQRLLTLTPGQTTRGHPCWLVLYMLTFWLSVFNLGCQPDSKAVNSSLRAHGVLTVHSLYTPCVSAASSLLHSGCERLALPTILFLS